MLKWSTVNECDEYGGGVQSQKKHRVPVNRQWDEYLDFFTCRETYSGWDGAV